MSGPDDGDRRWLDAAARFARPSLGLTAGEPVVAALVVDPERQVLVARAVTGRGGMPRADAAALAEARASARGATLYVTLEPEPEAAAAIAAAGIARAVMGQLHPDRRRRGDAMRRLAEAGVAVVDAGHAPSRLVGEGAFARAAAGRPFVTARLAVSEDGMVGRSDAPNALALSSESRRYVEMERALSEAVMVGARAAAIDNPDLAVHIGGLASRTHLRVVAVGQGALPASLDLTGWTSSCPTLVVATPDHALELPPIVRRLDIDGRNGRPDLRRALAAIAGEGVSRLLVEGGARLTQAMLAADLVDRFHLIRCPGALGRSAVAASGLGAIDQRLYAAGLVPVAQRDLGHDRLETWERAA